MTARLPSVGRAGRPAGIRQQASLATPSMHPHITRCCCPPPQELVRPDVFWYTSAVDVELPFDITGLVAFELFVMHWVESRRGCDTQHAGTPACCVWSPACCVRQSSACGARAVPGLADVPALEFTPPAPSCCCPLRYFLPPGMTSRTPAAWTRTPSSPTSSCPRTRCGAAWCGTAWGCGGSRQLAAAGWLAGSGPWQLVGLLVAVWAWHSTGKLRAGWCVGWRAALVPDAPGLRVPLPSPPCLPAARLPRRHLCAVCARLHGGAQGEGDQER